MQEYNILLRLGIGDLICCKSLLLNLKDTVVNIGLNHNLIMYRGPNYYNFIDNLARLIFFDDQFRFSENPNYPCLGWEDLYKKLQPQPISLKKQLCSGNSFNDKYICLCTKIRGYDFNKFLIIKDYIIESLNSISDKFKIIILGEKIVEINKEYEFYKDIYSIYPYIDRIRNKIDFTIPKLGIITPEINKFRQDCLLMSESVITINIGIGGNVSISTSISKTINLFDDKNSIHCNVKNYENLLKKMQPNCDIYYDIMGFCKLILDLKQ